MTNEVNGYFDEFYYAHCCGLPYGRTPAWFQYFERVRDRIISDIAPKSILDAGCAWGILVEKLREAGLEAFGIDISEFAIVQVEANTRPFCWVGSIADAFPQRYDLIVCIEVVEHMPADQALMALQNFCHSSDDILFSSSPEDYKEATHINVHPIEYWTEQFARQGFFRDMDFDGSFITPWTTRYRKMNVQPHQLAREYDRRFYPVWKENVDLRTSLLETHGTVMHQEKIISDQRQAIQNQQEAIQNQQEAISLMQQADAARVRELQMLQQQVQELQNSKIIQIAQSMRGLKRRFIK